MYPADYYAYQDKFQVSKWRQFAKKVLGYHIGTKDPGFPSPGRVLDIGCGSGWWLEGMRAQGWETFGVEISEQAAALGRISKGLQIFAGTLEDASFDEQSFDFVRANHSLEHISCPNETLDMVHRILKPEGKFMVGVPNVNSFNARLFGEYWWHLCAPVHTFSYSVKTLSHLLDKHGFRVERVKFNSDYFGILGSFQIWLNRNTKKKSMQGFFVNNYPLRLLCQWMANLTDLFGCGDMIEITAVKHNRPANQRDALPLAYADGNKSVSDRAAYK